MATFLFDHNNAQQRRTRKAAHWGWVINYALLFFLILFGLGLLLSHRIPQKPPIILKMQTMVLDITSGALNFINYPVQGINHLLETISGHFSVYEENKQLKTRLERQERSLQRYHLLYAENKYLHKLMGITDIRSKHIGYSRIIGASSASFVNTAILPFGTIHGARKDHIVRTDRGLVGRIIETGRKSSRALLITDAVSHVPVRVLRTGQSAMVSGLSASNEKLLAVTYLSAGSYLKRGDYLVTSGVGGIYPPDIVVARVVSNHNSGPVRARPVARIGALSIIEIVTPSKISATSSSDEAKTDPGQEMNFRKEQPRPETVAQPTIKAQPIER